MKSNIREEINLANYNLNDLKNRLLIMNKTNSDDITNLLFAKSNDIINNANNFMKKYTSKDEENDNDNNKNEEVEKENIEKQLNYDEENSNSQGNTSIHENESNTHFKRKEKFEYERSRITQKVDRLSKTQKVDSFNVNELSKEIRKLGKGKMNSKKSINTENNENDTKKKEDTDELLARIDKLLISNGLLDRTNKDLVLHLKHLEDEIEYINKHR